MTFPEGMYANIVFEDAVDASGTGKSLHEVSVLVR